MNFEECVYVAVGVHGLLKVGRTKNPAQREKQLQREFRLKGDVLSEMRCCDRLHAAAGIERAVIDFVGKSAQQHSGKEWFIGADADSALAHAHKLTNQNLPWQREHFSPEGQRLNEERIAHRRAMVEQMRVWREKARAEHRKRQEQKRLIRARAERAFAALASTVSGGFGRSDSPAPAPAPAPGQGPRDARLTSPTRERLSGPRAERTAPADARPELAAVVQQVPHAAGRGPVAADEAGPIGGREFPDFVLGSVWRDRDEGVCLFFR